MPAHFAAFTFVDRITQHEPGVAARGEFDIPVTANAFPQSLLAEATGQLAAWVGMAKLGWRLRPVAGIAHETLYYCGARPGDRLVTEIHIDSCEDDAIAYQGVAYVNGTRAMVLNDCVGPMLPLEEFDDAAAMHAFMERLLGPGAATGRFAGLPALPLEGLAVEPGVAATATFQVPATADFFLDHFPRRPVFPGTLLLDGMIRLAAQALPPAGHSPGSFARKVSDVKLRAFTEPGTTLELSATFAPGEADVALLAARVPGQKRPVGAARVEFGEPA